MRRGQQQRGTRAHTLPPLASPLAPPAPTARRPRATQAGQGWGAAPVQKRANGGKTARALDLAGGRSGKQAPAPGELGGAGAHCGRLASTLAAMAALPPSAAPGVPEVSEEEDGRWTPAETGLAELAELERLVFTSACHLNAVAPAPAWEVQYCTARPPRPKKPLVVRRAPAGGRVSGRCGRCLHGAQVGREDGWHERTTSAPWAPRRWGHLLYRLPATVHAAPFGLGIGRTAGCGQACPRVYVCVRARACAAAGAGACSKLQRGRGVLDALRRRQAAHDTRHSQSPAPRMPAEAGGPAAAARRTLLPAGRRMDGLRTVAGLVALQTGLCAHTLRAHRRFDRTAGLTGWSGVALPGRRT